LSSHRRVALRLLNRKPQDVRLQLQNLILDLSILQRLPCCCARSASGSNRIVESTLSDFGLLRNLSCFGDVRQVGCCDVLEVVQVNLMRYQRRWSDGKEMSNTYRELRVDFRKGISCNS